MTWALPTLPPFTSGLVNHLRFGVGGINYLRLWTIVRVFACLGSLLVPALAQAPVSMALREMTLNEMKQIPAPGGFSQMPSVRTVGWPLAGLAEALALVGLGLSLSIPHLRS